MKHDGESLGMFCRRKRNRIFYWSFSSCQKRVRAIGSEPGENLHAC